MPIVRRQLLAEQHRHQLDKLEVQSRTTIELQVTAKANVDKMAALEKALAKSEDKIQALRHDYEFAVQEKANLAGQVKQLEAAIPRSK